jgi:hypothetical protein
VSAADTAFSRAAARKAYEATFASFVEAAPNMPRVQLADDYIMLEAQLDDGMVEVKTVMLTDGLLSSKDSNALGDWIYRQHQNLMQLGAKAVQACARDAKVDASRTQRLLALTLLHMGESVKWELITGRAYPRDYPALHGLMRLARAKKWQGEPAGLIVDGTKRNATIDQLYLRALLLDRFASGPLTREEIEVVDGLLWEWADALRLEESHPGGLTMRVDLDSAAGLVFGVREGSGQSLYMRLEPLEEIRRSLVMELHRGQLVARQGRAAAMPLEAHIAALAQLRKMFSGVGGSESPAPRVPRRESLPDKMAVLVGANEIVAFLRSAKATLRMLEPRNSSATGYLLVANEKAADDIHVGTLLGLLIDPREPPVLARVVRKVHQVDDGWQIGIEVISAPGAPIRTATVENADGKRAPLVFVPGNDRSGRFDSFAVSLRMLSEGSRYRVRAGGQVFTLVFNRVRRRGRDWALAGFEIVEASPG